MRYLHIHFNVINSLAHLEDFQRQENTVVLSFAASIAIPHSPKHALANKKSRSRKVECYEM